MPFLKHHETVPQIIHGLNIERVLTPPLKDSKIAAYGLQLQLKVTLTDFKDLKFNSLDILSRNVDFFSGPLEHLERIGILFLTPPLNQTELTPSRRGEFGAFTITVIFLTTTSIFRLLRII